MTTEGLIAPNLHRFKDPSPMTTKEGLKRPQGSQIAEHPLHPYEEERLRQCMRNSARLKELGIPSSSSIFPNNSGNARNKKKPNNKNNEDSDPEYDPSRDGTGDGDLIGGNNAKEGSKEKTCNKTNKQSSGSTLARVRFRSHKRVYAEQPPIKATRAKTSNTQPDAILTPSDIHVPPPSQPDGTQAALEDDGPAQLADNTHMSNGGDAIPCTDGPNNMTNEDGSTQHDDNNIVGDGAGGHNQMTTEGVNMGHGLGRLTRARAGKLPIIRTEGNMGDGASGHNQTTTEEEEPWDRGVNMGHGLERLTRARGGKLPIIITEGNIRPLVPVIAAKYATECNIAVRNHIPILKRWEDYKRQPALIKRFLGCLEAKFNININDPIVKNGCLVMMKNAVRQQRYKLKKEFFDPFPLHSVTKTSPVKEMSNEQWIELVESWKTPKKMEHCRKNKDNRAEVKFHQTTGCCSYPVVIENLGDEYKDKEPDAFDLFKICHYSNKKKGYTPTVQSAITEMENQLATPTDDEQPNSATQVVGAVLDKNTKNSHFLQNVGVQVEKRRSSLQNVQAQLEVERRRNAELQLVVNNQREEMYDLSMKV
ncbi:unnamed protein product [Urochloa decumbens]|uniref:Transposase n=1 Tax=Urochloa decumbens TaxID=240449 RepID=A0ABC9B1W9_9POAL